MIYRDIDTPHAVCDSEEFTLSAGTPSPHATSASDTRDGLARAMREASRIIWCNTGMASQLCCVMPSPPHKPVPPAGEADAFRTFARELALGIKPWTSQTAQFIGKKFDRVAGQWNSTHGLGRDEPVRDALSRGGPLSRGLCLELGSGTGTFTPLLTGAFDPVLSMDLSRGMLKQATGRSPHRVQADSARLPLADATVSTIVAIDMLLFPQEMDRVLDRDGVLLWINQLGRQGPLYLAADEVAEALAGTWHAVEADAGWGTWAALRRA